LYGEIRKIDNKVKVCFLTTGDFIDFIDKVDSLYDPSIKQGFIY
jgi:hypothetical protein